MPVKPAVPNGAQDCAGTQPPRSPGRGAAGCVPKTLSRARLSSRLDQAPPGGITLLVAPAGYGKTQLVRAWADQQKSNGTRLAWLDVSPDMHTPSTFFAALGAGLEQAITCDHGAQAGCRPADFDSPRQLSLLLRESSHPLIVVIDDYHLASRDDLNERLGWLLSRLNANVRVMLMARSSIDVALGQQWLHARVMTICAADLRLTDTELAELCADQLKPEQIARLGAWAEGWPAAVDMVLGLLPKHTSLESVLDAVMGSLDRPLARYISEQVLGRLPLAHQELLVQTAFLATLDADLAFRVTHAPRAWEYLAECSKSLVLSPREQTAGLPQFRSHPLIRQVLQARLAQRGSQEIAGLTHRAARCLQERGQTAEAVSCACAAREHELAAQLILASGGAFFGARHGWAALKTLLDDLPMDVVRGRPRLLLAQIYVLASEGQVGVACDLLQTSRRHASRAAGAATTDRLLLRDLAFVEIVLGTYTSLHGADGSISTLEAAVSDGDPGDYLSQGVLKNFQAWNYLRHGPFEAAGSCAEAAAYYFSQTSAPFGSSYTHVLQGLVELERANIPGSIGHYEAARRMFRVGSHPDASGCDVVDVFLAEAYYEQGRLAEARALCSAVTGRVDAAHFHPTAVWYRTMTALVAAEQGSQAGIAVLDRGIEVARDRGFSELEQVLRLQRIELALACGAPLPAESLAALSDSGPCALPSVAGLPSWRSEYMKRSLGARLLLMEGHCPQAVDLLQDLACECERSGRTRFAVEATVLLAIAHDEAGSTTQAHASLRRGLAIAVRVRLLRPFVEHASRLSRLLLSLRSDDSEGATAPFINTVLAIATLTNSRGAITFSQREIEILRQLSLKSENKCIARALHISPETVRFHLKNVYDKLGVKDRALVAEIARMRGVITSSAQASEH